jgi:hypothetical protein
LYVLILVLLIIQILLIGLLIWLLLIWLLNDLILLNIRFNWLCIDYIDIFLHLNILLGRSLASKTFQHDIIIISKINSSIDLDLSFQ